MTYQQWCHQKASQVKGNGIYNDKIRQYCREECKDLTCPLPESPRPASSSRQSTPGIDEEPEIGMEIEVPSAIDSSEPTRRKWQCGNCGQYGHNRRKCPNNQ